MHATTAGAAAVQHVVLPAALHPLCRRGLLQQQHHQLPVLARPCQPLRCRHMVTTCAGKDNSSSSSSSSPPTSSSPSSSSGSSSGSDEPSRRPNNNSWKPLAWLQRFGSSLKPQQPVRLALNLLMLFFLMRMWPIGGRMGLGEAETLVMSVPFSEFIKRVKHDDVASVAVDGLHISFSLKPSSLALPEPPQGAEQAKVVFSSVRPADYSVPYSVLEKNGVAFSAVDKRGNKLLTVMVYALYGFLLLSAFNRLPLRLPNRQLAGRKHKGNDSSSSSVKFADVAGVDEAKEELQEIVEYLRAPEKFSKLGARPPSGVLLVGPPGTGKTLLARAVAGEADVPFFSISASEFVELYVGMGAMRVRELFANARKEAPAIVFIDEIDAVAKGRDMRLRSVGNDEREQTLNQLLTELDGFDSDKDNVVICIAATNRPDVLDQALLRPGRFDRRVAVERPDKIGREQILGVHLQRRGLPLADDVSVEEIATMTMGFTGADLANLVNEAALLAGRTNKALVGREEFSAAVLRSVAGIEKKRSILQGMEKEVVARHEVGHALVSTAVSKLIAGSGAVAKLSIVPRTGGALGFTYIPPSTEDRALMFDREIRGQLAMLMGGRAAEQLTCAAVSTGAVDDIRRATDLALRSVSEFGLSAAVGPLNVGVLAAGSDDGAWLMRDNGKMATLVEAEVKALLAGALAVAVCVISANKGIHDGLSSLLTKQERVEGDALAHWLENVEVPDVLRQYVLEGALPTPDELQAAASVPALNMTGALQQLKQAAAAATSAAVSAAAAAASGEGDLRPSGAAAAVGLDAGMQQGLAQHWQQQQQWQQQQPQQPWEQQRQHRW
uniref:AAA+ ATPase domain-containing protein n=1 Tax=Tetradesmus obliquus TaxID=3088 RepID=A0A383V3V6_TETOB|eukprot:jgi/Sobl393_1/12876/SZX60297.1